MKSLTLREHRSNFLKLRNTAISIGLKQDDIVSLIPRKFLHQNKEINLGDLALKCSVTIGFTLLVFYVSINLLIRIDSQESQAFLETLHSALSYFSMANKKCLVAISPFFVMYFRPPMDCRFCHHVHSIDRVRNLTTEEFFSRYAYTGRPVVVADGFKDWELHNSTNLNIGFIRGLYKKNQETFESCQYFPYYSNFNTLKEFMNTPTEELQRSEQQWYVGWGNCDPWVAQTLRNLYKRPYFLGNEVEMGRTDWIFMGRPGPGAFMHIDVVHSPTWQAQLRGFKKWTLKPPSECFYECHGGQMEVILQPGEIIVIDSNRWFHKTEVVGDDLSIAIGAEFE